jgi:Bacterial PH domain
VTVEYEIEPIPGLPGNLPPGEAIIWQGSPDWQTLARAVFHTRLVAVWFVFVASLAFVGGGTGLKGAVVTLGVASLGLGILYFLARASARSTIYTLTNRRVVMRFGVALPKCINLPLKAIGAADVRVLGNGRSAGCRCGRMSSRGRWRNRSRCCAPCPKALPRCWPRRWSMRIRCAVWRRRWRPRTPPNSMAPVVPMACRHERFYP